MNSSPENLAASVGSLLRQRRRTLGVGQRDLASLAGVAVHTLSNLESGKGNPSLDVLGRLLDCLGLQLVLEPRTIGTASTPRP